EVDAAHQRLRRRKAMVDTHVGERLPVVSFVIEMTVGRQHERRQRRRQERGPVLHRVIAGPAVQPNSAENALVNTANSWMAPSGTVASIVCRPQPSSLLAPSSMNV